MKNARLFFVCTLVLCQMIIVVPDGSGAEFTIHNDMTATDMSTGLMWQRQDDKMVREWSKAFGYCKDLVYAGFDDWRLASKFEMFSIYWQDGMSSSIDKKVFPAAQLAPYWTGTELPYYNQLAYFVDFGRAKGFVHPKEEKLEAMAMKNKYYARCIRGKRKAKKK